MINKLIIDGQNISLNESTKFPFTYTFSKAGVHNVRVGLDQTDEVCAYAFQDCSDLTKVVFPSKIENIKRYAFENCTSLKTVDLPSTIKYVGPGVFDGCIALKEINFEHTEPPQFYADLSRATNCYIPDGYKFKKEEGELVKDGTVQYYEKNSLGGYDPVDYEALIDGSEYYYDKWDREKVHESENIIEQRFKIRATQIDFIDVDEVVTDYPTQEQGTTAQIFPLRITPEDTTNSNIIYLSSNPNLVTVSETGEMKFKKYASGRATVYAITEPYYDGTYVAASLRIRVTDNSTSIPMTLSFGENTQVELEDAHVGDTITIPTPTLTGDDSLTNPEIVYSSSNENVVKFEDNEWKIKGNGTANIIAMYEGDEEHKSATATYKVTVELYAEPKQMTLSFNTAMVTENVHVGDEITLQRANLTGDSTLQNPEINYEVIDDNNVLNINADDTITVAQAGQVIIKATYAGDRRHTSAEAQYIINVVIVEEASEKFYLGQQLPTNANINSLTLEQYETWTESSPKSINMTSLSGPTNMFLMLPASVNSNNVRILDTQNNNMGISFNSSLSIDSVTYNIYDILLGQGTYRFFIQ